MSLIKEIKTKRLSKEERLFLEIIDGMKVKDQDKYIESVFWVKDNELLFEQDLKNGYLFVDYHKFWSVFSSNFELNYQETSDLIKGIVEKHLNWKGLTSIEPLWFYKIEWRNI